MARDYIPEGTAQRILARLIRAGLAPEYSPPFGSKEATLGPEGRHLRGVRAAATSKARRAARAAEGR